MSLEPVPSRVRPLACARVSPAGAVEAASWASAEGILKREQGREEGRLRRLCRPSEGKGGFHCVSGGPVCDAREDGGGGQRGELGEKALTAS